MKKKYCGSHTDTSRQEYVEVEQFNRAYDSPLTQFFNALLLAAEHTRRMLTVHVF